MRELLVLAQHITITFNLSELRDLCFDLNVNYENLPGDTLTDKARELVTRMERRGRTLELQTKVNQLRPNKRIPQYIPDQNDDDTEIVGSLTELLAEVIEAKKTFNDTVLITTELTERYHCLTRDYNALFVMYAELTGRGPNTFKADTKEGRLSKTDAIQDIYAEIANRREEIDSFLK